MLCLPTTTGTHRIPPPTSHVSSDLTDVEWPKVSGAAQRVTTLLGFPVEQEGWVSLEIDQLKWYTDAKKFREAPKRQLTAVISLGSSTLQCDIVSTFPVLVIESHAVKLVLRLGTAQETHQWWSALSTAQLLSRRLNPLLTDTIVREDDSDEEVETPRTRHDDEKVVDVSQSSALRQAYEQVLRLIIRPPRASYSLGALGPSRFTFLGRVVIRRDFYVTNRRGLRVHASLWQPYWGGGSPTTSRASSPLATALRRSVVSDDDDYSAQDDDDTETVNGDASTNRPQWASAPAGATQTSHATLIYLHGNASGRVEALCALTMCCTLGLSLCAIDCAGSGHSDGDYVSLGHYESEDVAAVVAYLRRRADTDAMMTKKKNPLLNFQYGLWGRSMGAMTSLLYACRHAPHASCLILDSPFTSLERLCKDLVRKATDRVPRAAVAVALRQVRTSVKYRSGFDLRECDALTRVPSCVAPALFVHGLEDDFIASEHTDEIYAAYGGKHKSLMKPPGNHNATRPSAVFFGIERFLKRHLPCQPLSKASVKAMSSQRRRMRRSDSDSDDDLSPTRGRQRWNGEDIDDFTLDDLSKGDNVYLQPPWKFSLGPNGHDPTLRRQRSFASPRRPRGEFISGMSDERQQQSESHISALFGQ